MGRFLTALLVSFLLWPLALMEMVDDHPDKVPFGFYIVCGIGVFFLWRWTYAKYNTSLSSYVYAAVTTLVLGVGLPFLAFFILKLILD